MKIIVQHEDDMPDDMVCPYCCSDDITMCGDPEYNDMWACYTCGSEFNSWIERRDFKAK